MSTIKKSVNVIITDNKYQIITVPTSTCIFYKNDKLLLLQLPCSYYGVYVLRNFSILKKIFLQTKLEKKIL